MPRLHKGVGKAITPVIARSHTLIMVETRLKWIGLGPSTQNRLRGFSLQATPHGFRHRLRIEYGNAPAQGNGRSCIA